MPETNRQGCRICGSMEALLPGTFYFARHFLLKDEKWWQVAGGSKDSKDIFSCQALFKKIFKVPGKVRK